MSEFSPFGGEIVHFVRLDGSLVFSHYDVCVLSFEFHIELFVTEREMGNSWILFEIY